MGAYINALREEGTRADLLREIERLLDERDRLRDALTPFARAALRLSSIGDERLLRITYDNGGVLAEVLPSEVRTAALLVKPHAALGDKP